MLTSQTREQIRALPLLTMTAGTCRHRAINDTIVVDLLP